MRSFALLLLACLVACSSSPLPERARQPLAIQTQAGVQAFQVELVRSPHDLWTGLRWRKTMAADHGMLFDLGEEEVARFTMSDTLIPLDMLFIGGDGRILKIVAHTVPGEPGPYTSGVLVRGVLELNAGTAERTGIQTGDVVHHPLFVRR
ncbi:MAG: DUF192 domain-containing protein [Alphaproteobacteria bacterium]